MNSLTSPTFSSIYAFLSSLLIISFFVWARQKYSLFTAYVEALYFFEFNHFSNINEFF